MPTAIITGASQGFGRALAADLSDDGWDLVLDARHETRLLEAAEALRARGGRVTAIPGDVADPDHRVRLVEAIGAHDGLDLLVNNASSLGPSPLPTLDRFPLEELETVLAVNTIAPLGLVQLAVPRLRAARGTVVAVTSDAAAEAYEGWGGYGASKAALEQLHHVLAVEEPLLHVYSFDPGDMRTQMHQDAFPGEDISDRPEPELVVPAFRRLLRAQPPNGRYRAADLAAVTS